ncbi:hypothetical protein AYR66_12110 [Noviherbaspirillum denitrificans]|uniref:Uncharacterized protein n=2 Tax=Noviherbaspirillum denitrificans TaxID=1968433 RepID=A0A254TD87_9BURK|nr:hypothetical protein AYR66_12110 [Noviherbaspirillum denitrificans]
MVAAIQGSRACVALLLSFGAEPNVIDFTLRTAALHRAALSGSAECVECLLKHRKYNPLTENLRCDRAVDVAATSKMGGAFESWHAAPPVWSW